MKFHTGDKTIRHDGKTYGPDGEIDVSKEIGERLGLAPAEPTKDGKPEKKK